MKISVIIPVYNSQDYLRECVRSITSQTYRDLEVLLVDDGSTDGSGDLCDALAAEDQRVVAIHKPNGGTSSARNTGVERATGDYLTFCDLGTTAASSAWHRASPRVLWMSSCTTTACTMTPREPSSLQRRQTLPRRSLA